MHSSTRSLVRVGFAALISFLGCSSPARAAYDLVVTSIGGTHDVSRGSWTSFAATIKNVGNSPTPAGTIHGVSFWVDGTAVSWSDTWTSSLAPGQSVSLTANSGPNPGVNASNGVWIATPGPHEIKAWVDDVDRFPSEADETNNITTTWMVVAGDSVREVSVVSPIPPRAGQSTIFRTVIDCPKLSGPAPSFFNVSASFYLDGNFFMAGSVRVPVPIGDNVAVAIDSRYIQVDANGSNPVPNPGGLWVATPGMHVLEARIDGPAPSRKTTTFEVGPASAPAGYDLVVVSILGTETVERSAPVEFLAEIQNVGGTATPTGMKYSISFWVDGQRVSSTDKYPFSLGPGERIVLGADSSLPPGSNGKWIATPGEHQISAWVDDVNRFPDEADENNNIKTTSMVVRHDTVLDVGVAAKQPLQSGDSVYFTAWIDALNGDNPIEHFYAAGVRFYLDGEFFATSNRLLPRGTGAIAEVDSRFNQLDTAGNGSANPNGIWIATPGTHTIEARTGEGGGLSSKTRTFEVAANNAAAPDLVVDSISFFPAPLPNINESQSVIFGAVIRNIGNAPTPAGTIHGVSFWVDGHAVSWSDTFVNSLAPGESVEVHANNGPAGTSVWTATGGPHEIMAWVDDVNRIPFEADEDNNTRTRTLDVVRFPVVLNVGVNPSSSLLEGDNVTFTALVRADYGTPSRFPRDAGVRFYLDGSFLCESSRNFESTHFYDAVVALDSRYFFLSLDGNSGLANPNGIWIATPGTHTIEARTGSGAGLSSAIYTFEVKAKTVAAPDLVVESVFTDSSPSVSDKVLFRAKIRNVGTAPTPAGVIHGVLFWIDGQPVTWSDAWTGSLAPGQATTVTATKGVAGKATWVATPGKHTLMAWVDDVNRIPGELDESNNKLSTTLTVSVPKPDKDHGRDKDHDKNDDPKKNEGPPSRR